MSRIKQVGVLLILLSIGSVGCASNGADAPEPPTKTYANPIKLADEWGEYGLGDPFVFSYNGYYYLYVSTRDTDAGVKVWRSDNLVDWIYEGLCAEDPITTGAYAPEVRYWNGKFYMYTSPAGQGHYALVSDSPTGPFTVATENFGRTIDGTTFVDDDGRWYFYYAGAMGIQASPMTDPLTVAPEEAQTGAYMGGWTEGPTVFKHDDKIYMTYTGNHVFSAGYRVDVASSDSPLQGFEGQADNPVLLRSEGATVGLGHNSVVTGPDLDTQYIVYHNLEGHGIVGPLRHMNIDRIVWNGSRLQVAGPTSEPQPVPSMPVFSDRFEGDKLGKMWKIKGKASWNVRPDQGLLAVSSGVDGLSMLLGAEKTSEDYTAEFHVQHLSGEAGKSGVVFSYKDDKNYGIAQWNPATREIEARVVKEGASTEAMSAKAKVPDNLDFGQLQNVRIEVSGKTVRVFAGGLRMIDLILREPAGAGKIGYAVERAKARFGYIAFSDSVNGSGTNLDYAPVPGLVNAMYDENGQARANGLADDGQDEFVAAKMAEGTALTYRVNVAKSGEYSLRFRVKAGASGAKFRLTDGKTVLAEGVEVKSSDKAGGWRTATVESAKLEAGFRRWTLEIQQGDMAIANFKASVHVPVTEKKDEFDVKSIPGWTRYEGVWSVKDGQLRASSVENGKILTGENGWTDYAVQADVTVPEAGGQTGILVRVSDPANGLELNQNRDEFLRGYYVYVDEIGIHLARHNYNTVPLADKAMPMPKTGEMLQLKVQAIGNRITVYAGGSEQPAIDYSDIGDQAFLQGRIGFKSVASASRFDHLEVAPIK